MAKVVTCFFGIETLALTLTLPLASLKLRKFPTCDESYLACKAERYVAHCSHLIKYF